MKTPKLTKQKIALAFTVAVIADAIQFPITAATATGVLAVPAEGADFALDCVVMVITSALLGFHWLFLPSLVFEMIPGFDLLPTWTGCVVYVVCHINRLIWAVGSMRNADSGHTVEAWTVV